MVKKGWKSVWISSYILKLEYINFLRLHLNSLLAGRSGDRNPVVARFFAPVQTGPGAYPASCTIDTGSFLGVKRPGRDADHPPPSKCRGHERVGLYLYSPFGPSWPVIRRTFTFTTFGLVWFHFPSFFFEFLRWFSINQSIDHWNIRLKMFDSKCTHFWQGTWESILDLKEKCTLKSSTTCTRYHIIRMIKEVRWAGHVSRTRMYTKVTL